MADRTAFDVLPIATGGGCGGGPYALKSAGGQSFCYDASGRMTSRGGHALDWYSYDLPSVLRATANQSAEFSYGVDRARYKQVRKTGSTVDATILYIGGLLEKDAAGGTTTWRHYVSARGRTVAQVLRSGSTNTVPRSPGQRGRSDELLGHARAIARVRPVGTAAGSGQLAAAV
jgi:hypothetical protein